MLTDPNSQRRRRLEAARGYLLLEMPDHAFKELQQIPGPTVDDFEVFQLCGEAWRQKQEYEDALVAFELAEIVGPGDLAVALGMAWCYKRIGELSNAITVMESAYRRHPDAPIVLYNLSCYLALAGDKERALSWLGRALRMQPSFRKLIPDESDFNELRHDADFQFITGLRAEPRKEPDCE